MLDQHRLPVLILIVALLLGCRKDKDSAPPTVVFLQPGDGSSVSVPDTIAVSLAVSDDRLVESLSVLVADVNGVPISASVVVPVNERERTVHIDLPLLDERIESGTYVLTASASDGNQDGRAFRSLVVQAAPLRVRSTFLIPPASQSSPFIVTRIDSVGSSSSFASLNELAGTAIDRDHLYTAGTATHALLRWDLRTGNSSTLAANPGTGNQAVTYFHGLASDPADGRVYVGTHDGRVLGFASSGTQTFTSTAPGGYRSEATVVVGENLISAAYNQVSQQRALVRHAYSSGVVLSQFATSLAPIGLFERNQDHLLLFGNTALGGAIHDVHAVQGGTFIMREFPGEAIQCVARIAPGVYALGFASGIRRFSYQNNSVVTLSAGLDAACLTFNPVSGALLVGSGSNLIEMDPNTGAAGNPWVAPNDIGSILLQLNR